MRALSYIDREAPFVLTRPLHLVIGPDEPFPADLPHDLPLVRGAHAGLLDRMGAAPLDRL